MNPKLSICIITYNRSGCLKECLDSIMISVSGYESQIEIIVSDNASTDDTADIIRSFQITYPWIRYHRNNTNIGGERNLFTAATMASGEYIWIFGDDDKMKKEAIANVIKQIDAGYNLIICNYSVWAKDFSYIKKTNGLRLGCDEVFDNPDELMRRIGYHVGYISSIIIKKDVFFKCPASECLFYEEYGFPQIYAVYSGIFQHCNAIYISSTLVCNRSENYGKIDWCKVFVVGMSKIFEDLANKGYSKNSILSAKHGVLRNIIILVIIALKLNNWYLPNIYLQNNISRVMFHHYKKNWLFWVGYLPVFLMPAFLFRFAKKTVSMVRQSRAYFKGKNHEARKYHGN